MTACKRCYGDGFAACMCDPLDAGVLSSDAPIVLSPVDADRVAALIEERPGPTEAMRALFAERRPSPTPSAAPPRPAATSGRRGR